jgi:hypothetical protein
MRLAAREPFAGLSLPQQRRARGALVLAVVAQVGAFSVLERRMKSTGGPGIIPFELAGTPKRARQIMDTWGPEGQAAAKVSLILDFPFPATYAALQALACTAAGRSLRQGGVPALADAAGIFAWSQFAAAGFDYVENTSLLAILAGRDGALPALARRAARAKFALLYAGWSYILLGMVADARRRLTA